MKRLRNLKNQMMTVVFLFCGITWGSGYPNVLRYPAYLLIPFLFMLSGRYNKPESGLVMWSLIICLYTAVTSVQLGSFFYLVSLISYVILVVMVISPTISRLNQAAVTDVVFFAISINTMVLVAEKIAFPKQFLSGLFPEPSHLGYSLGPLLSLLMFKRKFIFFTLINLLATAILSPSSTFLVSFVLMSVLLAIKSFSQRIFFTAVVLMITGGSSILAIAAISNSPLFQGKYESMQVWLFGFKRAIEFLKTHSQLGGGTFGWIPETGEIASSSLGVAALNQRDLASLIPFGLATFGICFPLFLLKILSFLSKYDRSSEVDQILSLLSMSYLITLCFRWAGPTLSPFLSFFCITLCVRYYKNSLKFSQKKWHHRRINSGGLRE